MFKGFDIDILEKLATNRHENKRQRRKTVKDKYITTEVLIKLVNKCLILHPTRKEIVLKLMDIGISNNVIAQVINAVIPDAKATSNSVASIVNNIRKENKKVDELLQDIEEL